MSIVLPDNRIGVDTDYLLPGQIIYASHFKTFCEDANWLIANRTKSYICFSDDALLTGSAKKELNQWILDVSPHCARYAFIVSVATFNTYGASSGYLELSFTKSDGTTVVQHEIEVTYAQLIKYSNNIPFKGDLTTFGLSIKPPSTHETYGSLGISHFFMYENELTSAELP